jgi:antitoxin component of RelBE/YafQ-DinJ toxin-antitoxin module
MMAETLVKDKIYNFRTNNERLEEAKQFLESQGRDLPGVFNAVIDQIVLTKTVPVKTSEEIQAEVFLDDLKATLRESIAQADSGEIVSASEVYAKYGL